MGVVVPHSAELEVGEQVGEINPTAFPNQHSEFRGSPHQQFQGPSSPNPQQPESIICHIHHISFLSIYLPSILSPLKKKKEKKEKRYPEGYTRRLVSPLDTCLHSADYIHKHGVSSSASPSDLFLAAYPRHLIKVGKVGTY